MIYDLLMPASDMMSLVEDFPENTSTVQFAQGTSLQRSRGRKPHEVNLLARYLSQVVSGSLGDASCTTMKTKQLTWPS